jgi:hypothetical protein
MPEDNSASIEERGGNPHSRSGLENTGSGHASAASPREQLEAENKSLLSRIVSLERKLERTTNFMTMTPASSINDTGGFTGVAAGGGVGTNVGNHSRAAAPVPIPEYKNVSSTSHPASGASISLRPSFGFAPILPKPTSPPLNSGHAALLPLLQLQPPQAATNSGKKRGGTSKRQQTANANASAGLAQSNTGLGIASHGQAPPPSLLSTSLPFYGYLSTPSASPYFHLLGAHPANLASVIPLQQSQTAASPYLDPPSSTFPGMKASHPHLSYTNVPPPFAMSHIVAGSHFQQPSLGDAGSVPAYPASPNYPAHNGHAPYSSPSNPIHPANRATQSLYAPSPDGASGNLFPTGNMMDESDRDSVFSISKLDLGDMTLGAPWTPRLDDTDERSLFEDTAAYQHSQAQTFGGEVSSHQLSSLSAAAAAETCSNFMPDESTAFMTLDFPLDQLLSTDPYAHHKNSFDLSAALAAPLNFHMPDALPETRTDFTNLSDLTDAQFIEACPPNEDLLGLFHANTLIDPYTGRPMKSPINPDLYKEHLPFLRSPPPQDAPPSL